jgi:hypothetical protein
MNQPTQHALVAKLEAELLPSLQEALPRLHAIGPAVRASVFALPFGSATSYQGFHLGISCLLPVGTETEPDEVALVVSACHLDREPKLNADVSWGHPSGAVEAELAQSIGSSERWPLATAERLAEVRGELPRLIELLCLAVKRGHP